MISRNDREYFLIILNITSMDSMGRKRHGNICGNYHISESEHIFRDHAILVDSLRTIKTVSIPGHIVLQMDNSTTALSESVPTPSGSDARNRAQSYPDGE
jgi:hypothetical protein